jgi:proline iminopeptidase
VKAAYLQEGIIMRARTICLGLVLLTSVPFAGPAAAEERLKHGEFTVELNGMKLWYKVSGKGPVCLMSTPSWGCSSDLYFRTLGSLEKRFTVVYLDTRGTGRSGRARLATEYTWDHLVADLDALRDHLKQDRVWLMGHSDGGVQVLHYACKHPQRVRGMLLLDTIAVSDAKREADVAERRARRKGQPWYNDAVKLRGMPKSDAEFDQMLEASGPLYWSDPKKGERFKDDMAASKASVAALEGSVKSKRSQFDLRERLKKVSAPALIVVGDDDFVCSPESATVLHLCLPNSKYLLIEKCGHFPWLEQPAVFEERVPQFLAALGISTK